jgi:hypothetical protein
MAQSAELNSSSQDWEAEGFEEYPIITLEGKTYIQMSPIRLKLGVQLIAVLDVTEYENRVWTDPYRIPRSAMVASGEGRYALVRLTGEGQPDEWHMTHQALFKDIAIEVRPANTAQAQLDQLERGL